jgi:SAM-dependent methyltransferase
MRVPEPRLLPAARRYWSDRAVRSGRLVATRALLATVWEFLRDSTPARLRQRYGDADYDWDLRVNTTSAAVGWRDRLLGAFHSPYQPTEPALFHEMLSTLARDFDLNFRDFTFLDLGSGKGRTLLMASDYPFRRIVGVELLPALDRIAQENLRAYKNESQKCFALESVCADATAFPFPDVPLVIYLFNPFPESGLRRVAASFDQSLRANPRPAYLLYHNPLLEHVLIEIGSLCQVGKTDQYSVFASRRSSDQNKL